MQYKQFPADSPSSKPLVTCIYGWKRTFTLYQDRIDVDGTKYALDDLVHVRSIYRTVMNIPSVRLELCFRVKDVVLRGIAAVEDAKRVVEYLDTYCADTKHMTSRLRWSRTRQGPLLPQSLHTPSTTDAQEAIAKSPLALSAVPISSFGVADRNIKHMHRRQLLQLRHLIGYETSMRMLCIRVSSSVHKRIVQYASMALLCRNAFIK